MVIPASIVVLAQSLAPISTDRPDFTEGARAVPVNTTQIETGVTYMSSGGVKAWTAPEALVRHSLGEGLEARFGLPNYLQIDAGGTVNGIADPSLGFKLDLNNGGAADFALIGQATFAAGDRDVRSERTTPAFALAWATADIAGMVSASFPGGPADFRNTLVVSRPVSNDTSIFAEYVLDFSEAYAPSHIAHFGLAKAVGNDAQVDFHFGFGLNKNAPDFFVGAGYSVRF